MSSLGERVVEVWAMLCVFSVIASVGYLVYVGLSCLLAQHG